MTMTLNELKAVCTKAGMYDWFRADSVELFDIRIEELPNDQLLFIESIREYPGKSDRLYFVRSINVETGRVGNVGDVNGYHIEARARKDWAKLSEGAGE